MAEGQKKQITQTCAPIGEISNLKELVYINKTTMTLTWLSHVSL